MENLISLDEYKLAKSLSKTDNDDQLTWYITSASSIIQTYLNREFSDTGNDITETFNLDYDTPVLYLEKFPVTQLVSIQELDTTLGYDSTVHFPTPTDQYYLDAPNGKLIRLNGGYWPQGPASVIVTYTAGFAGGVSSVPADLKQATIDLVTYYVKEEYKPNMSMRGASITNPTTIARGTIDFSEKFPPHIQRILDMYK